MSTPGIVIRRLTPSSPNAERGKIALDDLEVLIEPIELAQVAFDGKPFVLRQDLVKKPCAVRSPRTDRRAGRRDQVAVQDRLDDVLQARPLPDDLIAPGHLPAKRLRRLIWNPDFRQKAACIQLLSTLASIVSVLIFA